MPIKLQTPIIINITQSLCFYSAGYVFYVPPSIPASSSEDHSIHSTVSPPRRLHIHRPLSSELCPSPSMSASLTSSSNSSIWLVPLMDSFLILSILVPPKGNLNIFSVTSRSSSWLSAAVSKPNVVLVDQTFSSLLMFSQITLTLHTVCSPCFTPLVFV